MDACHCRSQTWVVEWEDGGRSGVVGFASEKAARLGSLALVAVLSDAALVRVRCGRRVVESLEWQWRDWEPWDGEVLPIPTPAGLDRGLFDGQVV